MPEASLRLYFHHYLLILICIMQPNDRIRLYA
jgi:hypothetical protein